VGSLSRVVLVAAGFIATSGAATAFATLRGAGSRHGQPPSAAAAAAAAAMCTEASCGLADTGSATAARQATTAVVLIGAMVSMVCAARATKRVTAVHGSRVARKFANDDEDCTAAGHGCIIDLEKLAVEQPDLQGLAASISAVHRDQTSKAPASKEAPVRGFARLNEEMANARLELLAARALRQSSASRPCGSLLSGGSASFAISSAATSASGGRALLGAPATRSAVARRASDGETDVASEVDDPLAKARKAEQLKNAGTEDEKSGRKLNERAFDESLWEGDMQAEEFIFDPTGQVGAMPPLGFFDPLGFCNGISKKDFRFYRAAEIKHGRVAMMASIGSLVEHWVKLPGLERAGTSFQSRADAFFTAPGNYWLILAIVVIFTLELSAWAQMDDREPGDFGDPFGVGMYDTEMRNRELNNGRFAMFAIVGIVVAQLYTGKDAAQQLGFY